MNLFGILVANRFQLVDIVDFPSLLNEIQIFFSFKLTSPVLLSESVIYAGGGGIFSSLEITSLPIRLV